MNAEVPTSTAFLLGWRCCVRRLGCATSRSYPTQRGRPRLPDTDILCSDAYDLSC